jgi:hypothetical protein
MKNDGGKLVFDLDGKRLAVEMRAVLGLVEVPRIFFIPGKADPVKGIISNRGEAVVVVDMRMILGLAEAKGGRNKVIILSEGFRTLGLFIGDGNFSFQWKGKPGEDEAGDESRDVEALDWTDLFDNTAEKLLTGARAGEDSNS